MDRDSRRPDGTFRDDRDRYRFRARLGLTYRHSDHLSAGLRVRTGPLGAAQWSYLSFGGELTPKQIALDRAFIRVEKGSGYAWFGKNTFPFWRQTEHLWDGDATPEGAAIGYSFRLGERSGLTATAGYFILDGLTADTFVDQAKLIAGQGVLQAAVGPVGIRAAAGLFIFRDNPKQVDERLEDRAYTLGVAGGQIRFAAGTTPVEIGAEVMVNFEEYEDDPSTMFNADEVNGYVVGVRVGRLQNARDWLLAYYYAHIEKYAVVGQYAHDDWVRWGTGTATRSSNYQGHEFRAALAMGGGHTLMARFFIVEGIALEEPSALAKEDGVRFRLDWRISF